jgi:16S rRNA (cytosine1402-N4)-methyltransferase
LGFTNHAPVLLDESLALLLGEGHPREGAVFVDATFGAGGHAKAILARASESRVVVIDADPEAVARARELAAAVAPRLVVVHRNFGDLAGALEQAGVSAVDGVLYDLGLSSMQLADSARGFSFAGDAPLDMRLDPTSADETAAQLLATRTEAQLAQIIHEFGDERFARRIARQIVTRRARSPLRTTSDLVAAVLSARPREASRGSIHPATRTFQALRIAVNREIDRLERSLESALDVVRARGRIVAISFHSGEDRAVKKTFKRWTAEGRGRELTRKPIVAGAGERAANPRSRSAKLRAVEKITEDGR